MGGSKKLIEIEAFGTRYQVHADPESERRIKSAVAHLEKKAEEASKELKKSITEPIPPQLFYAALGITEEMFMLREQIEDEEKSQREEIDRLGQILDKSLISKFVKIRMAYGAERQEGN